MGVRIERVGEGQFRIVPDNQAVAAREQPEVVEIAGAHVLRSSRIGDEQPVLLNVPDPVERANLLSKINFPSSRILD